MCTPASPPQKKSTGNLHLAELNPLSLPLAELHLLLFCYKFKIQIYDKQPVLFQVRLLACLHWGLYHIFDVLVLLQPILTRQTLHFIIIIIIISGVLPVSRHCESKKRNRFCSHACNKEIRHARDGEQSWKTRRH